MLHFNIEKELLIAEYKSHRIEYYDGELFTERQTSGIASGSHVAQRGEKTQTGEMSLLQQSKR